MGKYLQNLGKTFHLGRAVIDDLYDLISAPSDTTFQQVAKRNDELEECIGKYSGEQGLDKIVLAIKQMPKVYSAGLGMLTKPIKSTKLAYSLFCLKSSNKQP